jgi:hypothetical protein
MPNVQGIDRGDGLPGLRDVAVDSIGHFEAVTTPMPNADVRAPTPIGDDPGDRSARPGADESDPQPRSMSEVGGVNAVDDGDHVPASSIPIQDEERREEPSE